MSSMICEICHESMATVHLTEIVNNSKKEIHLCEGCAQQKGVAIHSHVKNLSIPEFFGQLVESKEDSSKSSEPTLTDPHCSFCGITYSQFRSTGKLGCPNDYVVFGEELLQLVEKIHSGGIHHRGKVPTQVDSEIRRHQAIEELRSQLKDAVDREEYEFAAELRDQIHALEREEHCS